MNIVNYPIPDNFEDLYDHLVPNEVIVIIVGSNATRAIFKAARTDFIILQDEYSVSIRYIKKSAIDSIARCETWNC